MLATLSNVDDIGKSLNDKGYTATPEGGAAPGPMLGVPRYSPMYEPSARIAKRTCEFNGGPRSCPGRKTLSDDPVAHPGGDDLGNDDDGKNDQ
jgi:hypothetical protein